MPTDTPIKNWIHACSLHSEAGKRWTRLTALASFTAACRSSVMGSWRLDRAAWHGGLDEYLEQMQKSCSPVAHSRRALGRRVAREPGAVEAWVNDEWLDGPSGRGVGMRPKGLVGWTSNWSVSLLGQNLGSPRPTWTTCWVRLCFMMPQVELKDGPQEQFTHEMEPFLRDKGW